MKKLLNLTALVMLVSVNVLTPFSYAQEIPEEMTENTGVGGENTLVGGENISLDVDEGDIDETKGGDETNSTQILNLTQEEDEIEPENTNTLFQLRGGNLNSIDMTNPVQIVRDGEIVSTYTGLSQAINEAESGDVINLMEDISVTEASVISGKTLTINGNNYIMTRDADITTLTVNEGSSLILQDITITDNAVNFAPNRYDALLKAKYQIALCLGGVNETRNESGDVTASVCDTTNVDTAKTHPQIYSVGNIYGDNLTISNSLNSKGSAAIIVEKGGIEMINSNFIHNGASGGGRGGAIRVGPNTATDIVDESPITKILFSGCYFESNYSSAYGGALAFHYAPEEVIVDNCIFSGNTAYLNGGAIHVPDIWSKMTGYLPAISTGSNMPIGTLYINNSDFYNNWCGNDGAVIEDDDVHLKIDSSNFKYTYVTQPLGTSTCVISTQAGSYTGRNEMLRIYTINNSIFEDTNTAVLGDWNESGKFLVNNCSFENQYEVILSYNGRGEIKNSVIKNSNPGGNCGITGRALRDVDIAPYSDYLERIEFYGEATFILENNTYINDCTTNEYFPIRSVNYTTGINNIIVKNEEDTRIFVHRALYDSSNIQGTDEIYYGATIDDGKYVYIKKNKFYNFDEFNAELENFSYGNSGYQLESGKTMLFYLDSGYTELWSGSISTTTNLYGKETDIHNITYEGMEGVDFEGITHTYKFNNLNHTQYLTELTPYTLNTPSKKGYKFEGWYLDSEYTIPVTSIETGSTGDIMLYAKWERAGYSGGGDSSPKLDTSKADKTPSETSEQSSQDDGKVDTDPEKESNTYIDSSADASDSDDGVISSDSEKSTSEGQEILSPQQASDSSFTKEQKEAYKFAKENGITTMSTIQDAKMDGKLTRIQMAKMLSQYAINVLGEKPDETKNIKFRDVTEKKDVEYDNGVTLAYQLGIMGQNMPNNRFRPNDEVTRAEFVTALSRMLYNTSDGEYEKTSKYYVSHMAKLYNEGIVNNTNPSMKEKRGYVMIMLMRSVNLSK